MPAATRAGGHGAEARARAALQRVLRLHTKGLLDAFRAFDTDGDGRLSCGDLEAGLRRVHFL